jgi:hypothetical protein
MDEKFRTHTKNYDYGLCLTDVIVEENGECGGDSGHGGFVNIKIKDNGGTALTQNGQEVDEINFGVTGDAERERLADILLFVRNKLLENRKPVR